MTKLRRVEDPLTYVSRIFLSLCPASTIKSAFEGALPDLPIETTFALMAGAVTAEYGVRGNITQPDVLMLGARSIVGIELKVDSTSSMEQIQKYALLFALERKSSGLERQPFLLFLCPGDGQQRLEELVAKAARTRSEWVRTPSRKLKPTVLRRIEEQRSEFEDVVGDLKFGVLGYAALADGLSVQRSMLGTVTAGDICLSSLISGYVDELRRREIP